MFTVEILAVGKLTRPYFSDAAREYEKRIKAYYNLAVTEIPEQKPLGNHPSDFGKMTDAEGEALLKILDRKKRPFAALAAEGTAADSLTFAEMLGSLTLTVDGFIFVIGSHLGLSDKVKARAARLISLSPMTFPHQLARVMLLEQIYRAASIQSGGKYHK